MSELIEAGTLFRAGHLKDAVAQANVAVRKAPSDLAARVLLAELLLFQGNLDRADLILDAAADLTPDAALVIAEFRQLLRGEQARRQLSRDGRVPELLSDATPSITATLAACVALRAGDPAEAATNLLAAEAERPRVPGQLEDGTAFDDLRDADDMCAGIFEVLTTTGKYYWIPTERIESVQFHPPVRPRDLFWRRATMSVRGGPDGDVYVPAIYAEPPADASELLLLGRETDWRETDGVTRGVGQRMFLIGDDAMGIMELTSLSLGADAPE
jgi:type VI secretion system protein ImpE